jgi:uncharacterized protein YbjT (DUF2867 family)
MPVVVMGASGFVGRRAVAAFARISPEVRAYVRAKDGAESLRALGAKVAVGFAFDVDNLRFVMTGAHTVCHLIGGLNLPDEAAYEESNLRSVQWALRAAELAKVRRFLFLSYPGASASSSNAYLRFKGLAEAAVAGSSLDYLVVRSTHVYGPGSEWLAAVGDQARRWPATVIGSGREILAPVFVDDVANALAAADDRDLAVTGVFGLQGPDRITADGLADLLAGRRRRKLHLGLAAAEKAARLVGRRVSRTALEVLAADSLADAPDAAAEFGIALTPLAEGLARSRGEQEAAPAE